MNNVIFVGKKNRINAKNYVLLSIITIPFLLPDYYSEMEQYNVIEALLVYVSLVSMVFVIVTKFRTLINSMNTTIILIALMFTWLVYVTYLNNGEVSSAINHSIKTVLLCLTLQVIYQNDSASNTLLYVVRDITVIFFILNMVYVIMYPHGIPEVTLKSDSPHFLFGNVNGTIRGIFPGLACGLVLDSKRGHKLSISILIFIVGMVYIYFFVYSSATTLIAILFLLGWMVFKDMIHKRRRLVYISLLIFVLYIELAIIVFSTNSQLMEFLAGLFQKSSDFSGRLYLWQNSIMWILANPITGYGVQAPDVVFGTVGNRFGSHNFFLDLMYQRGIIGLILFVIILVIPIKKLESNSNNIESTILMGLVGALLLMCLAEPMYNSETIMISVVFSFVLLTNRKEESVNLYHHSS